MSYQIYIKPSAKKELINLPDSVLKRIDETILNLSGDPRPNGSAKLKGFDYYRVRIGSYRLIYEIDNGKKSVTIIRIRHRSEVYSELR